MKVTEITNKNKTIDIVTNTNINEILNSITIILRSEQFVRTNSIKYYPVLLELMNNASKSLSSNLFDPNDFELNQTIKKIKDLLPELEQLIKEIR